MRKILPLLLLALLTFAPVAAQDDTPQPREIARLGRGRANALAWRPDGKVLADLMEQ